MLAVAVVSADTIAEKKSTYNNYSLPAKNLRIPPSKLEYKGNNFNLKGKKTTKEAPSVEAKEYLFAKQAFLSEKRDDAIKLLRQQLGSGLKHNRDNMLLRLGQLYTEKYMELSYLEVQYYNDKLREYEANQELPKKKRKRIKVPRLDQGRSHRYLKQARTTFTKLEKEFPRHSRMDEIVFFLGFVNMEFGQTKSGVRYLERVLKRFPKSRKYEEAALYLADYYFEKGYFKNARGKYRIILRRSKSSLFNYALYKTAWCDLNLGNKKRALRDMRNLVAKLEKGNNKANFNLRDQALRDLVLFFAELAKVNEAYAYFKDKTDKKTALENLRSIANFLLSNNKDRSAIRAFRLLLKEDGDSLKAPEYYVAIYQSQVRLGHYTKAVGTILGGLDRFGPKSDWADDHKGDHKEDVIAQHKFLENEIKNAAYFYHHTAQKTKNKSYYRHALKMYQALVKHFPDNPERRKMVFYQAEILFAQGKWLGSADMYMRIANRKPKDKLAEESLYNALLALDNLTAKSAKLKRFTKAQLRKGEFKQQPIPKGEKSFIEVAKRYLSEYPKSKRVVDVRFRIAAIYYRHYHFNEAVKVFKDIAVNHPKHKSAPTAAHIVLDIYNIQKDYAALNQYAGVFAGIKGLGNRGFRDDMKRIRGEVAFKNIEKLEKEKKWKEAGAAYLNFYKKNPRGRLAEQALYNSLVTLERTDDKNKTAEVASLFMKRYPKHSYVKTLVLAQATRAEESYDFAKAYINYKRFHEKYPKDRQAKRALYNAALYAELLEYNKNANELYKKYLRQKVSRAERRSILETQARIYAKRRIWGKVGEVYTILYREARGNKAKAEVLARQAELYEKHRRTKDRRYILSRLKNLTGDRGTVKSWGSAIRFVAENRFKAIKRQHNRYERIRFSFPATRLASRLKQKQSALLKLDAAYEKIVKLGVGEWGVAALHEKSRAYTHFVKAFRSVKIPRRYKGAELDQIKKDLAVLDKEIIVPLEQKSKEILNLCTAKASEFHIVSDFVSKCHRAKGVAVAGPSGLIPQPSYWTTRWVQ